MVEALLDRFAEDQGALFRAALYFHEENWQKATLNKDSQRRFGEHILVFGRDIFFQSLPDNFNTAGEGFSGRFSTAGLMGASLSLDQLAD